MGQNDVEAASILGTTTNNGDDLQAVTVLHRLDFPSFRGKDQAVEFHHDQPGMMAEGVDYLIEMSEGIVKLTCLSIHGELHGGSTIQMSRSSSCRLANAGSSDAMIAPTTATRLAPASRT